MKIYERLEKMKNENKIKYRDIYSELDVTKQNFYYHMKNLKNGKCSFSTKQLKIISEITKIELKYFFV